MGSSKASFGRSRLRALLARFVGLSGAVCCFAASPAAAQETASAHAEIVPSLSLQSTRDLDFGQIAYTAAGTVVLTAEDAANCTSTGGVLQHGACTAAVFEGYGQSGRTVRLKVPGAAGINLAGPGGATMSVTSITVNGSPALGPPLTGNSSSNGFRRYTIVSADGAFEFRIGGTLNVAAGQALGLYTATFVVEIAYE